MNNTHLCPKRLGAVVQPTERDTWNERGGDLYCSYCGSLDPEKFMEAVEAGVEVGPTDKSYKVYIGNHAKFYFQHLSDDQRTRFVTVLNSGKMKIGFPGRFYATPYFIGK